ncbi:MAG TPA: tetratricopeptide repeat protein [Thermoanaerobaculia bacterium]|jgi:tetratricopeptide (TPR) repeat protein
MSRLAEIDEAIYTAREDDFLRALTMFLDIYGTENSPPLQTAKAARGLSYFGLCLALVQKKYKEAIDLCKRAIDLEFYNGDHYANMARVYLAQGNRKKAYEVAEAGLKVAPESDYLTRVRSSLGHRSKPAVPFLDRTNPINVSLGQARHAKKVADQEAAVTIQPRRRK